MVRWGLPALLLTVGLVVIVVFSSGRADPMAANADGTISGLTNVLTRSTNATTNRCGFEDVTAKAGIAFRHFPAKRQSLLPEDMGSGLAWGDFDNDGDPDLFAVNFRGNIGEAAPPPAAAGDSRGRCALYRNNGDGTFTDVSQPSHANLDVNGLGAAWGDYDNDGFLDLYVTVYGADVLLHNNTDGTFSDVTAAAGVTEDAFSAGCAWGDYDNDGWLDLYVCNYVQFTYRPADRALQNRQYGTEIPYTLNPSSYEPALNRLYHNQRNGTFREVGHASGTDNPTGRSLQPVWFDFNNDGLVDLYVANDVSANAVFQNMGDGTFADIGASSLAADYRGAMGLGVGDHNQDGFLDIFITHWIAQENALFENMTGAGVGTSAARTVMFMEVGELLGLGYPSLNMVGWATGFCDFDNDGCLDIWAVNGHTFEQREDSSKLRPQALQLFQCQPGSGFFEVAQSAWPALRPIVGRGGACADYDHDGRPDLAILAHGEGVVLLRNTSTRSGNWFGLRLRQKARNIFAIGARVELRSRNVASSPVQPTDGVVTQTVQVMAGNSYLSQDSSDVLFGLGAATLVEELVIHWPDGATERHRGLPANQYLELCQQPQYR